MFFASCKDSDKNQAPTYSINRTAIRLNVLESFQLTIDGYNGQVIWSSNNENIAVVSENGLVTGISEGDVSINAKISGEEFKCLVTVMQSNDLPYLVVSCDELSVLEDGDYTINAKVYYKGELCEDAEISFEILDNTIARVDANGKVTGIACGTTQLNVNAKWNVFNDILSLKKTITINVKNGVSVEILSNNPNLYTSTIDVYGKSFSEQKKLDVVITNYGVELAKENITWTSSDETVATVDQNGLVQAVGVGRAQIKASYSKDGLTSASIPYEVVVSKPYIDLTNEYPVLVDCWIDQAKTQIVKDLSSVFDSDHSVISVIDTENGQNVDYYNLSNGVFNEDAVECGEYVWEIANEDYVVKTNVFMATKVLTTSADIVKLQQYGAITLFAEHAVSGTDDTVTEYRYQGYFALGNDVVFTDSDYGTGKSNLSTLNMYSGSVQKTTAGFYGIFEGMGHSIKNLKLGVGGLFGDVSEQGVVRNLNVYNASLVDGTINGAIARNVSGKIENVNLTVDLNDRYGCAGIAYLLYHGTLENVSVYATETRANKEGAPLVYWAKGAVNVNNVSVNETSLRYIASDEAGVISKISVNKFDFTAQNDIIVYSGIINAKDLEVSVNGNVTEILYAGRNLIEEVSVNNGKVKFGANLLKTDFFIGNNMVKITTDKTSYLVKIVVSDYALNSAKDFEEFIDYLNTGYTLYGKVVNVGSDIDFTGYTYTSNAKGLRGKAGDSGVYGFNGTLNGNGHVIKNMKVEWTLFNRTYNAIIRDLAFVDLEFQQNYVKGLITKADGTTTIENVYIKSSHNACYNRDYAIAETVGGNVTIKNCVIDRTHAVKGYLVGTINGNASLTLSNVYVIGNTSAVAESYNEQTLIGGEGVISTKENALSTITTAGLTTENGWNMALWSVNEQGDLLFRDVAVIKAETEESNGGTNGGTNGVSNEFLESMDNGVIDNKNWEGLL